VRVTVRLGEPFWRTLGERETVVALRPEGTAREALAFLSRRCPALAVQWSEAETKPVLLLDGEVAEFDRRLTEGSTLHVLWPVSGG